MPLGHWSYEAADKLIGSGFIDSAIVGTKPFSRLEMARLVAEAIGKAEKLGQDKQIILAILSRLKKEFTDELVITGSAQGLMPDSYLKPVEDPYLRYVFIDGAVDLENQRGDVFDRYSNYRVGFASRMKLFDILAGYLHPEYVDSSSDPDRNIELIEGYGKLNFGNFEIEIGKDSLWWGPGYHGSMLMSNNVEPFKMLKISNPRPVRLPWIFSKLGPFKAVWFLTELEKNRVIPKTRLTGLRLNFKPNPYLEAGLSRAIMFDGSGREHLSLKDYFKVLLATEENRPGKLDNNQLAGVDVALLIPLSPNMLPVKSVKLYTDLAAEDEAGGWPSNWAKLLGIQFNDILLKGRTDLRIEYAHNRIPGKPNAFYNHHLYKSGYTYKDRVIGHHMGSDARDMFVRLTHYLNEKLLLGVEFDREVKGLSSSAREKKAYLGVDLTVFGQDNVQFRAGYRYEHIKNHNFIPGDKQNNHIVNLEVIFNF